MAVEAVPLAVITVDMCLRIPAPTGDFSTEVIRKEEVLHPEVDIALEEELILVAAVASTTYAAGVYPSVRGSARSTNTSVSSILLALSRIANA